jgi:hypothetical protein
MTAHRMFLKDFAKAAGDYFDMVLIRDQTDEIQKWLVKNRLKVEKPDYKSRTK